MSGAKKRVKKLVDNPVTRNLPGRVIVEKGPAGAVLGLNGGGGLLGGGAGGASGSNEASTGLPPWLESAVYDNVLRAKDASQIDYQPYRGPDIAAFTPGQTAAMQSAGDAAAAYGLLGEGASNPFEGGAGMPAPGIMSSAGGVPGYRSDSIYDHAVRQANFNDPASAMSRKKSLAGYGTPSVPGGGSSSGGGSGGSNGKSNLGTLGTLGGGVLGGIYGGPQGALAGSTIGGSAGSALGGKGGK